MTQTPAGWYPEPDPTYVGPAGRLRYWDGAQWTEHVNDPAPAAPPTYPAPVAPTTPIQYGQPYTYGQQPFGGANAPQYEPGFPVTPDGERLAGWWQRVLAVVLDVLIAIPLYIVAVIPVVASQWDNLSQWIDDLQYAADNNTANPPDPALFDPSTGPGLAFGGSILLAQVLYSLVFLHWKQATPGKLIVGLRVRLREAPALPSWSILARVGFITAITALGQLPTVGVLLVLVALLNYLWPLWDSKNQALHDKVARTNVVKVR